MIKGGIKKRKSVKKSDKKINLTVKIKKSRVAKKVKKISNSKKIDKIPTQINDKATIKNVEQAESLYEKSENYKKTILIVGVSFFMILIGGFWIYNTKQVFKQTAQSVENNANVNSLTQITDELSEKITEMKDGLAKIKEFENKLATTTATTTFQALPDSQILTASTTEISTTTLNQKLEFS